MLRNEEIYRGAERRIDWLTLALGLLATVLSTLRWGWRPGLGVAIGAALAWVNYRWLRQGVDALAVVGVAQADAPRPRVPLRVFAKFIGRYALLLLILYVILSRSWLPAVALLGGLFTIVAAVLAEMTFQLFRGPRG